MSMLSRAGERRLVGLAVLSFAMALVFPWAALRAQQGDEIPVVAGHQESRIQVLVEFGDVPAARVYGDTLRQSIAEHRTQADAKAAAVSAARNQINKIVPVQERFKSALGAVNNPVMLYQVQKAYNGIALQVDRADLAALRRMPGVRAVHILEIEQPTNSTSVPFLGAPNLWGNTLGLPNSLTGTGIRIGIIDTGIDYLHANFGGFGLAADYTANDRTTNADGYFPTAKVVGGTDLAGDAYNGNNTPVPDPDPMDCNGHGSHVAGTAAGLGVKADGSTYTGPYDNSAPFASLRIGPGVAPGASLYAIRVFGCTGGTGLTVAGIDWAMDPNGDNDLSDHLDVINMSLGSDFGREDNTSAAASDNAAAAGVIVVCSTGNAGDTYFIAGSPGNSTRAIATAASVDSGQPGAVLTVNSPAGIAGNYAASATNSFAPTPAPGPSGQTAAIVLAIDPADAAGPLTTDGCSALTNAAAVAGNIALVDRGTCGFQVKANNAQAAGAIGIIIANNIPGDPNLIAMGATGTIPVTVPTVMISQADRNTIVAQLPGVNATLGAATAADTLASFSSRGPLFGPTPMLLKPDISAPGLNITSTQTGFCNNTCLRDPTTPNGTTIPGNLSLTISGTSMASPHMAGVMALLRQEHPDWSVEQLKALAMNGALHNVTLGANGAAPIYGPGRIGAGRVDPSDSATASVVALNDDHAGAVSVSFESTQVVGTATEVKKVRLINTGTAAATYDLSISTLVDAPGIAFSLPGGSTVTIPAGDSLLIDVQMDATGSLMNHTREARVAPTQAAPSPLTSLGSLARHWLTEEAGYLVLSQSGNPKLRLPLYLTSRPASTMAAPATIPTGGNPTGSTTIPLTGSDVCTGTLGAGPTCTGTFPTTEVSLVTPFELQVVSPQDESIAPPEADIQYGGVAFSAASGVLMFGVSTWGNWTSPTATQFNIYIDNNSDGVWDRILYNEDPGRAAQLLFGNAAATGQDSFISFVFNLATSGVSTQQFVNRVSSAGVDSALFNNNVMFLAATPASLGITGTTFRYKIVTCPGFAPLCKELSGFDYDEANGPFTYNFAAQGLNFGGTNLAQDLNGAMLPVTWNTANMATNGSLGALLIHHHNKAGLTAQTIALQGTPTTDLAITKSVAPANPVLGQNVTFTLTVTNNGPSAATGIQVTDLLPAGLTYVSDDSGGSYDPILGPWTVGSLAVSASATLHITATVSTTDQVCNLAQITAVTPLDPTPGNNQSTVCVMAPHSADVAVSMTVSSPTVLVGNSVTYTITAKNNGGDTAYAIDLQEAFAAFPLLNPASFTASQGSYNPATGLWNLASLASGATATLAINVTAPNTAGPLTDQATAAAATTDPDNANNTASATTTVLSPATVTATKTVAGTFRVGQNVTYTVTLSNSAAFDQQDNAGPEFTDTLPASLTLVSATATSGTAGTSGNTATWNGVVPAGGSVTVTITATITAGTAGTTISNQGTVNYDADGNGVNEASNLTDDPSLGGATDPTSFLVLSPATVSGTMTASGSFEAGTNVTYTVVLTNTNVTAIIRAAQGDNPGPEFVDALPAQLTLVSASATSGVATATVATNTVTWDGSIPAGGTVTITIVALINPGTGGQTVSNQGTINFDADGNGTNESSALTDDPSQPGAADPTTFGALSIAQVPTLGGMGLITLCLLLAGVALLRLRRRTT